jgi:ABC-type antimicrobial peptide transport system permease subunit
MYEGIIVVCVNIVISSLLATCIFGLYKLYLNVIKKELFVIYMSPYSMVVFLVISIFMTLAFSLIFAIQSSKVEIIKHLKSE